MILVLVFRSHFCLSSFLRRCNFAATQQCGRRRSDSPPFFFLALLATNHSPNDSAFDALAHLWMPSSPVFFSRRVLKVKRWEYECFIEPCHALELEPISGSSSVSHSSQAVDSRVCHSPLFLGFIFYTYYTTDYRYLELLYQYCKILHFNPNSL
jgi:hypothetical protein